MNASSSFDDGGEETVNRLTEAGQMPLAFRYPGSQRPPRCSHSGFTNSHIRIDAKRQALDALVEVSGELSQSRHSLRLSGSPPSGKLLIPLERRDVRVVEGARLESVCRGNSTVGSNPTLSAKPSCLARGSKHAAAVNAFARRAGQL
jgi:hypothetical protein